MYEYLVWLLPLTVAALGARSPRTGLVVFAAALPFFGSPPGGPYLGAFDVAALAVIATCWRRRPPRATPLAWPALTFVIVGVASLVPLAYQPPSWSPAVLLRLAQAFSAVEGWPALYTWRAAADLVLGWGLFVSVRRAFDGRSLYPLAAGFLAGLSVTVLAGFAVEAGLLNLDAYRPRYRSNDPEPRLASLFFLSGWLAEYVVVAGPLAIYALARKAGRRRMLLPLLIAAAVGCLALTRQRGAWLAAAAQLAVAGLWLARRWHRQGQLRQRLRPVALGALTVTLLVGGLLLAAGDVEHVIDRAASIRSGPTTRLPLWRAAGEMFSQRPLQGWGIGSFAASFDVLHPPGSPGAARHRGTAHNLYLHTAAEGGLLGLAALALLIWGAVRCLARPRSGNETTAMTLAISLVGVLAYGGVQQMLYLRAIAWMVWLILGCASVASDLAPGGLLQRLARVLLWIALALVPVRMMTTEPPPLAGSRSFGLHEPEGDFRWTEGRAAVRLPRPESGVLTLSFANGHPKGGLRPVTVIVGIDGEEAAVLTVPGGWQTHDLRVDTDRGPHLVLTLDVEPTFRPFSDYLTYPDLRRSRDIRELGVAVRLPSPAVAAP